MSQRLSPLSLSCNPLRTQRRQSVLPPFASAAPIALYHDYIRFQTSGKFSSTPELFLADTDAYMQAGSVEYHF